jgi:ribosomal protein S18 acetylase RimI-like enzyme
MFGFWVGRRIYLYRLSLTMELRTLENASLPQITAAFNESFSDYFIKLQFTSEGMATKMKGEGILQRYSVGAFDGGQLVGFILHGYDIVDGVKTVYNAGTGVIPAYRGKGLTTALYNYCIPLLNQEGIHSHLLEVIDNNHTAKKIYDAVGFETVRRLVAFRCTEPIQKTASCDIREIDSLPVADGFMSVRPAWQNSTASINRDKEGHALIGAFEKDTLAGYAAYVPATGRIKQVAVFPPHRGKRVGTALFQHMLQHSGNGQLLLTNVDEACQPAIQFLTALGFRKILGLYEMKMQVA